VAVREVPATARATLTRRGRATLRLVATLLLVAGIACAGFALRADEPAAAARTNRGDTAATKRLSTPLFSPRRLPSLFTDFVANQRLQSSIDFAFGKWDACVAVDAAGRALARRNGDEALAPASTQKLLTGAAALAAFGPDHRFTTRAVTTAPVTNGVVPGNVWVVGGGDPMLATPTFEHQLHTRPLTSSEPVTRLAALADAIVAAGVHRIDGSLLGDDSRHDDLRFLPVWKPSYRTDGEIGALSALAIDHGFTPPGSGTAPADPAAATTAALADLLAARGVTVGGTTGSARAPAAAKELAHLDSAPLANIVEGMLTASDNFAAETLVREVGVAVAHDSSTDAGTKAVATLLQRQGVTTKGLDLHDGSGLAPSDRVTCDTLVGVVDLMSQPRFAALDHGLAVAGRTGTLALRFLGDPLQGVLRAKTGHIDGVAGLAGVVDDAEHLRFAFLVNGQFGTAQGEALQATVARLVAAYPQFGGAPVVPAP
jgi:D-alanyl-D-alanine carboxypeptidase/D-alanyl-D-alanine-endopeptidase (penicillin-binding protein 4)